MGYLSISTSSASEEHGIIQLSKFPSLIGINYHDFEHIIIYSLVLEVSSVNFLFMPFASFSLVLSSSSPNIAFCVLHVGPSSNATTFLKLSLTT